MSVPKANDPTREDYERAAEDAGKVAAALRYKRQNPTYADALDQWAYLLIAAAERMTWRPMDQRTEDDCWIACIASITGLPLEDFPQPPSERSMKTERPYIAAVRAHLVGHGWFLRPWPSNTHPPAGLSIASGPSPRREDIWHSVVYRDGLLVHDPHASRMGLPHGVAEYDTLTQCAPLPPAPKTEGAE